MANRIIGVTPIACLLVGTFLGFLLSSSTTILLTDENRTSTAFIKLPDTTDRRQNCDHKPSKSVAEWSQVHVFTGRENYRNLLPNSEIPPAYFRRTIWFSQARQDEIVARLLRNKRKGYFIDLAANDAVRISNTFALERNLEWSGLCIEPNPIYWAGLAHRNCITIGAVIGSTQNEVVDFRFPREKAPKGGIVGPEFDNKSPSNGEVRSRATATLADILRTFEAPHVIDYLSLDVEGAELFVMEGFPFDKYTLSAITVERATPKLASLLSENGYMMIKKIKHWGETLWIHESLRSNIDMTALQIDSESYKYRERS